MCKVVKIVIIMKGNMPDCAYLLSWLSN